MLFERKIGLEDNKYMCMECKGKSANWNIDCSFNAGVKETEDDWDAFEDYSNSLCKRLNNLCKLADEPVDMKGDIFPDDKLSFLAGNVYAECRVEKGNLIFEIDFRSIGGDGEVSFNFGCATEERVKKINRLVSRMYDFLVPFMYFVKHHLIDTAEWDDFEEDEIE